MTTCGFLAGCSSVHSQGGHSLQLMHLLVALYLQTLNQALVALEVVAFENALALEVAEHGQAVIEWHCGNSGCHKSFSL